VTGHKNAETEWQINTNYFTLTTKPGGLGMSSVGIGGYEMAHVELRSPAARFFDAHPEFRRSMSESKIFPQIRDQARLKVDGEELYIIRGDTLGEEEDLYLEALIRGAASQGDLNRALFEELDDHLKNMIRRRNAESGGFSNE
jgi:hypothetical protein